MQFRTTVKNHTFPFYINHDTRILSVGSCFADMIGGRLLQYKFDVVANPFGNIFNPVSIYKLLLPESTSAGQFIQNQGYWFSYDLHSEFHAPSKEELLQKITNTRALVDSYIKNTDLLILTFGTAWAYKLNESKEVVANCHKMPSTLFEKSLLSHEEIVAGFKALYDKLKAINPNLKFLLTVSPVRHIKDTIELNSVSKSILRVACHTLSNKFEDVFYFPAYELLIDDLRDYRFYKKDMIHPNEVAEEYVWEYFIEAFMDSPVKKFIADWNEIIAAMQHKPFQPHSYLHQQFIQQTITKIEALGGFADVKDELDFFRKQLD